MKLLILLAIALVSCQSHRGQIMGKVVDVSWGGRIFDSCEIVIQKGEGSSSMDKSSSPDKNFCNAADELQGKMVLIKYETTGFCPTTETCDIIQSIGPAE